MEQPESASLAPPMLSDERGSLKRQKKEYRDEKKRVAKELVSALRDPTVVVMADWLKVRGTLRKWNRYYCVLKPGLMLIYKNNKTHKHGYWVGTILLNTCELLERPSKKDGFCFKLYHPLDQSMWATRGPLGESHGAVTLQPLPTAYLICRAPSEQAGRCWMDALELSLRCSGLLMRTMHKLDEKKEEKEEPLAKGDTDSLDAVEREPVSDTEAEKHFDGLDDQEEAVMSEGSDCEDAAEESAWTRSEPEAFGLLGDGAQTEEVGEENKSLVWSLLKQVRPGMDLSKVVLPTFILEPRSFLEKLADYYYHADLLAKAAAEDDPFERMVAVTKFYLSGFYKKPKGLKKPYNPILGETFRCSWQHPDGSNTYYIAEQVSHHPPVSSLFVTNRKAGFNVQGTILAKSKYYGNSLSAMMLGSIKISLLARGETYTVTLPYANCKGIMIGTLTMEMAGQVSIECDRTDYSTLLDFKLKPMFGGSMNQIAGSIKYGKETLAEIDGHWDGLIRLKNLQQGTKQELWNPTPEMIKQRLPRFEIPEELQEPFESVKLWSKVTAAIAVEDQYEATKQKTVLEEEQRTRARSGVPHKPRNFKHNPVKDIYEYVHAEYRPWNPHNDVKQIEHNYEVRTITRLKGPKRKPKPTGITAQMRTASSESSESNDERPATRQMQQPVDSAAQTNMQESLDRQEVRLNRLLDRVDSLTDRPLLSNAQIVLVMALFGLIQAISLAILRK